MRIFLLLTLFAWSALLQAMPPIQSWQTDNGAKVMYVAAHELPMVDIRMVFDAGAARDGNQPGLAVMTNALLDQGAGDMTTDVIAQQLDQVGARLDSGAERDMAWVGLRSLSDDKRFESALEVLETIVAAPRFADADFQRERERALVGLKVASQQPGDVAKKAFYNGLYGDHPYATPPEGTLDSVAALTREDLLDFHRRFYVARNLVIAIVGDIERTQAEQLANRLSEQLPAGQPAAPIPSVDPLQQAQEQRITHSSSQSHILVGQPGLKRGDPDYFSLYVGNYILGGGGLVSRISDEIREKRGLAYSAYSYFLPMAEYGPFQMGLQTKNAQADQALTVLRETLQTFVEQGPTEDELTFAQSNITGGYPLRIDSNSEILGYLAMIGFYDLPLDYLEQFNSRISAVTRDQVHDAFQRRIDPERLLTVIVGGE